MNIGKQLKEELDDILFTKIRCQVLTKVSTSIPLSDELLTMFVDNINRVVTRQTTMNYEYR